MSDDRFGYGEIGMDTSHYADETAYAMMCKPKTNADRIRSMTDNELASFFRDYVACDDCPVEPKKCGKGWIPCKDVALSWLKKEVSE